MKIIRTVLCCAVYRAVVHSNKPTGMMGPVGVGLHFVCMCVCVFTRANLFLLHLVFYVCLVVVSSFNNTSAVDCIEESPLK